MARVDATNEGTVNEGYHQEQLKNLNSSELAAEGSSTAKQGICKL